MLDLTLGAATRLYTYSSIAAIVLAFFTAIAALLTYWASAEIGKHNDRAIASARSAAAQADAKAAIANERAAEANALGAQANMRAKELAQENLKLGLQLEAEKKSRIELEQKLGHRKVSPQQEAKIIQSLRGRPPGTKVTISHQPGVEPGEYAGQIAKVLATAGVAVQLDQGPLIMMAGAENFGVHVNICRGTGAPNIKDALLVAEIDAHISMSDDKGGFDNPNLPRLYDEDAIAAYITVFPKKPYI